MDGLNHSVRAGTITLLAAVFLSGCSASSTEEQQSLDALQPQPQSQTAQSAEQQQSHGELSALPFNVVKGAEAVGPRRLVDAFQAEPTDFTILGQTVPGDLLPGPSVRALLDPDSAFGALMSDISDGEITDLAQLPSELGIIQTDGTFQALPNLTDSVQELPGSNPDDLYFEPQNASVHENLVIWREGSAGARGAMPSLDTDDWRLVVWDRDSQEVRELASAFSTAGTRSAPRSPWDGAPTTDGQNVYFEAMMPDGETADQFSRSILSVPLDSPGQVEVLAQGAAPVADPSQPGVFWVSEGTTVMHSDSPLFSIEGGGWQVAYLAASEEFLVATVASESWEPGWMLVWDISAVSLEAAVSLTASWAVPVVSGKSMVWGSGSADSDATMFYWDADSELPRVLGNTPGFSLPQLSGDLVALPVLTDEGAIVWQFARL